jgi:hypothetical protein
VAWIVFEEQTLLLRHSISEKGKRAAAGQELKQEKTK